MRVRAVRAVFGGVLRVVPAVRLQLGDPRVGSRRLVVPAEHLVEHEGEPEEEERALPAVPPERVEDALRRRVHLRHLVQPRDIAANEQLVSHNRKLSPISV